MKRKLALGVTAVTASIMLTGATAWATGTTAPVPTGVTAVADQPPKSDSTLRGQKLRSYHKLRAVGIHGRATVRDKKTTFTEYTWQRGVITAKGENKLTVKSKDGLAWNWNLDTSTKIRRLGVRADLTKLVVGDEVFAIGVPTSTDPKAAAVFVPRDRALPDPPSATPGS
ncbi:hypothetical protein GCM10022252_01870 [Streptosporangium oxazolinicum]|uniref:DUF5666 domain-containing protein n=1 Tax=Streptosporangium oxazolinicum TaxID=909287 RepID=A0ABP8A940_9ACTN